MKELDEILKEWYPTFSTHWEEDFNCPCKDCATYRITQARTAILSLIKSKQMSVAELLKVMEKPLQKEIDKCHKKLSINVAIETFLNYELLKLLATAIHTEQEKRLELKNDK